MPRKDSEPKKYQRTEADGELIDQYLARLNSAPKGSVRLDDNVLTFGHDDNLIGQIQLMESLNVKDLDFLSGLLLHLSLIANSGFSDTQEGMNFILSVVKNL